MAFGIGEELTPEELYTTVKQVYRDAGWEALEKEDIQTADYVTTCGQIFRSPQNYKNGEEYHVVFYPGGDQVEWSSTAAATLKSRITAVEAYIKKNAALQGKRIYRKYPIILTGKYGYSIQAGHFIYGEINPEGAVNLVDSHPWLLVRLYDYNPIREILKNSYTKEQKLGEIPVQATGNQGIFTSWPCGHYVIREICKDICPALYSDTPEIIDTNAADLIDRHLKLYNKANAAADAKLMIRETSSSEQKKADQKVEATSAVINANVILGSNNFGVLSQSVAAALGPTVAAVPTLISVPSMVSTLPSVSTAESAATVLVSMSTQSSQLASAASLVTALEPTSTPTATSSILSSEIVSVSALTSESAAISATPSIMPVSPLASDITPASTSGAIVPVSALASAISLFPGSGLGPLPSAPRTDAAQPPSRGQLKVSLASKVFAAFGVALMVAAIAGGIILSILFPPFLLVIAIGAGCTYIAGLVTTGVSSWWQNFKKQNPTAAKWVAGVIATLSFVLIGLACPLFLVLGKLAVLSLPAFVISAASTAAIAVAAAISLGVGIVVVVLGEIERRNINTQVVLESSVPAANLTTSLIGDEVLSRSFKSNPSGQQVVPALLPSSGEYNSFRRKLSLSPDAPLERSHSV